MAGAIQWRRREKALGIALAPVGGATGIGGVATRTMLPVDLFPLGQQGRVGIALYALGHRQPTTQSGAVSLFALTAGQGQAQQHH